jgi:hypothetical protein
MPEIRDIVDFAQQKKPVDIMTSFNDLMAQRVAAAVADRKIEVAAKMFNPDMDDETLERIKASAVQQPEEDAEDEENTEENQDLDDEESNEKDSDEDFELSDEEWAELGIEDWDFEDEQNSDTKDEE